MVEVSLNQQDLSDLSRPHFQSYSAFSDRGARKAFLKPSLNTSTLKRSNTMTTKATPTENLSKRALQAITEVESCAKSAAEVAREFLKYADEKAYIYFLDVMYHYTLESGQKCATAAKHVQGEDIKKLFMEFDTAEALHYRLALKDLEAFGVTPSNETPETVVAINDFWISLQGRHDNGYLAMLYVFENVAKYLQDDVAGFVERLCLGSKEKRWICAHAKEDLAHGKILMGMLRKHIEDNPTMAVAAAKQASALWSTMMLDVTDDGYQKLQKVA